jgi:hypothetical protein
MKRQHFVYGAGALALGLATLITPGKLEGQLPLYDRVEVNLPYTITVNNKTLQPGNYVIQESHSASAKNHALFSYSNHGKKFETSAVTIPTYDPNTAESTRVILHKFGRDYYFDKIWVEGKDYGYEFPLPNSVKERQKEEMQPIALAATYSVTPEVAEVQPQTTTEQAAPQPSTPVEQPAPAPPEANREVPKKMPRTSADWLMMLLSGGSLSGLGLALRRRRG